MQTTRPPTRSRTILLRRAEAAAAPRGLRSLLEKTRVWLAGTAGWKKFRFYRVRLVVQGAFTVTSLVLGIQFARFVAAAQAGATVLPYRPPGAEGYLPISGMIGALDWLYRGTLNVIHPAATVLFLTFLGISLVFRRSFCSWICPVGFLSESLGRVGQRLFKRNSHPPKWLDVPLRGFRYLLLGFFVWAILSMGRSGLAEFIASPYNKVADVKMYLFFAHIGTTGLVIMGGLVVASVLVNGAWCRYFCPYGALLGLGALLSPFKIRRDEQTCIDCGLCDRVCMSGLPVSMKAAVSSVECTGCLDCTAVCPVPLTLFMGTKKRWRLGAIGFATGIMLLFFAGYTTARAAGAWDNQITGAEYQYHIQHLDGPAYGHPGR